MRFYFLLSDCHIFFFFISIFYIYVYLSPNSLATNFFSAFWLPPCPLRSQNLHLYFLQISFSLPLSTTSSPPPLLIGKLGFQERWSYPHVVGKLWQMKFCTLAPLCLLTMAAGPVVWFGSTIFSFQPGWTVVKATRHHRSRLQNRLPFLLI
jgi:hypothetical protein